MTIIVALLPILVGLTTSQVHFCLLALSIVPVVLAVEALFGQHIEVVDGPLILIKILGNSGQLVAHPFRCTK
ncbi:hypothetical protein N799_05340 [Lysobacter arseniciresistens ZS79]|uniref:Uncharacterized protein n=1 Tax=Lysobacter arseniciresistens ZS79 TaxID=913325 RepID=A0A0A0F3U4_9GAMM|nr:hypothetical protein N799_05340 [Lysobacter arseniciresistens ZS79]